MSSLRENRRWARRVGSSPSSTVGPAPSHARRPPSGARVPAGTGSRSGHDGVGRASEMAIRGFVWARFSGLLHGLGVRAAPVRGFQIFAFILHDIPVSRRVAPQGALPSAGAVFQGQLQSCPWLCKRARWMSSSDLEGLISSDRQSRASATAHPCATASQPATHQLDCDALPRRTSLPLHVPSCAPR